MESLPATFPVAEMKQPAERRAGESVTGVKGAEAAQHTMILV